MQRPILYIFQTWLLQYNKLIVCICCKFAKLMNFLIALTNPFSSWSQALKIELEYRPDKIEIFVIKASRRKVNLSTSWTSIRQIVLPGLTRIIDYMIQYVELINQPAGDYLLKIFFPAVSHSRILFRSFVTRCELPDARLRNFTSRTY